MSLADDECVIRLIELARTEDLGGGDVTAGLMAERGEPAAFVLLAKQAGIFAGREAAPLVLRAYGKSLQIEWSAAGVDGGLLDDVPCPLATIRGPLGVILSAERVLLNFLQRLCGVATLTRQYVDAVADTGATIYDTRKTTPGWRTLDKYAVRCGGGSNHRMGLFDAVLIKDNHLAGVATSRLARTVFDMLNRLEAAGSNSPFVQVEADSLAQVEALLTVVGVDSILLDNFSLGDLGRAVGLRNAHGLAGKVALEASGGVTLDTVRAVGETGVDRISVGALTHAAAALDLSLERC